MKMTLTQWVRFVLGLLILGAVILFLESFPKAKADTPDDQFMRAVTALGVTGDRSQLIADGHAACDNYGTAGVVGEAYGLFGQGMDRTQASGLMLAGIKAYCPEKIAGSGI